MIVEKKICLLGGQSVGKTSLVRRFVENVFSEEYLTTIGVKIDRKTVAIGDRAIAMMLWDIEGDDMFNPLQLRYLRSSAGCIIVADGTRRRSIRKAIDIHDVVKQQLPDAAATFVVNKVDRFEQWALDATMLGEIEGRCGRAFYTSAKTGEYVEQVFVELARQILDSAHGTSAA